MKRKRLKFFATADHEGLRVDKFLSLQEGAGTRSQIQNLISAGEVYFRGVPVKSSHRVHAAESFEVFLPQVQTSTLEPYDFPLNVVFEDNEVIVVDKPAGLVVHPAHGHANDTLINALIHHNKTLSSGYIKERPGLIHRLDRDTSGLLVVAKTDHAQNILAKQFENKSVHRRYQALCFGKFPTSSGTLRSHLARHPQDRKRFASVEAKSSTRSKLAITHYKVLSQTNEVSFVELRLETGRTHQIRVHLSEMGHPILGDDVYGGKKRAKNFRSLALRKFVAEMNRFALHAFELGFCHPSLNTQMIFRSEWPPDLTELRTLTQLDVPTEPSP